MGDEIRIGQEPPPAPPPRSGKLIGLLAGLALLVAAAAWLVGTFRDPSTRGATTSTLPPSTTTNPGATTTAALSDRLDRARGFWTALGAGDATAAINAVAQPDPGAADLIAFVAAFSPGLTVRQCEEFDADTVECLVTITDEELVLVGQAFGAERPAVSDDGSFDLPEVVAAAAARLSLHALTVHTEEVRAACPLTGSPQVQGLAIVGSPTAACGAYLAGLIPEYLAGRGSTTTLP